MCVNKALICKYHTATHIDKFDAISLENLLENKIGERRSQNIRQLPFSKKKLPISKVRTQHIL